MQVLGAISIKNIGSTQPSNIEDACFNVVNNEKDEWHLCANTDADKEEWFCAIGEALGNPCRPDHDSTIIVEEIEHIQQPVIMINTPSAYCNDNWGFYNHGNQWECKCIEGNEQSPIDLPRRETAIPVENAALFDYSRISAGNSKIVWEENMIKIKPKEDLMNFGYITDIDSTEYEAYEIRIHTPSEHKIRGK